MSKGDIFLPVPKPSISAFFPCYNDAKTIGDLVLRTDRLLAELSDDYEIIVVNVPGLKSKG